MKHERVSKNKANSSTSLTLYCSLQHLRNSPKSKVARNFSDEDMNSMFENITTKMYGELEKHTETLDRLDTQSKEFDRHMKDLKVANLKEMDATDKVSGSESQRTSPITLTPPMQFPSQLASPVLVSGSRPSI